MSDLHYRTLARVLFTTVTYVWFVLPGWSTSKRVPVQKADLPEDFAMNLKSGDRVFVMAKKGKGCWSELDLHDWEWPCKEGSDAC